MTAPEHCTVLLPDFVDMDTGPRCGEPAVKRLPEPLDFPVCAEHAAMFSPDYLATHRDGWPRRWRLLWGWWRP